MAANMPDNIVFFNPSSAAPDAQVVDYFGSEENIQLLRQAYIDGGEDCVAELLRPLIRSLCKAGAKRYGLSADDCDDAEQIIAEKLYKPGLRIVKYLQDPRNNSLSPDNECIIAWLQNSKAITSDDFKIDFIRELFKKFVDDDEYGEYAALQSWLSDKQRPAPSPEVVHSIFQLKQMFGFIVRSAKEEQKKSYEKLNKWFEKSVLPAAVLHCVQGWLSTLPEDSASNVRLWLRYPRSAFPKEYLPAIETYLSVSGHIACDTKGLHYEPRQRTSWLSAQVENILRNLAINAQKAKNRTISIDQSISGEDDDLLLINLIAASQPGVESVYGVKERLTQTLEHLLLLSKSSKTDPLTVLNSAYTLLFKMLRPKESFKVLRDHLNTLTVQDMYREMLAMLSRFDVDLVRVKQALTDCFADFMKKNHAAKTDLVNKEPVTEDRLSKRKNAIQKKMINDRGKNTGPLRLL